MTDSDVPVMIIGLLALGKIALVGTFLLLVFVSLLAM